jgi:hypothetical protein
MADERENRPRLPPRWFVRLAWYTHRGIYRVTGGRVGLWRPRNNRWAPCDSPPLGVARGKERSVILGYMEDGPNLVTLAMNGWADGEPVWWLNLPSASQSESRSRRPAVHGHGKGRRGRGTVTLVGQVAGD